MNKRLLSVLVSGLLAFTVLAGPGVYAADGANDPEKRVCKKMKDSSSHMPRRICKRQKHWDKLLKEAKEAKERSGSGG